MALMNNKVPINFGQGIDTKTDDKLVLPGKLLELENAVFTRTGALNKRNGYVVLPKSIQDNGQVQSGSALGRWNDELNLYTGSRLLTYSPATETWVDKGGMVSVVAKRSNIVSDSRNYPMPSVGFNAGFTVYAWDEGWAIKYSVVDQTTGVKVVNNKTLRLGTSRPKVVPFLDNLIVVFSYDSSTTQLVYDVIAVASPNNVLTSGVITSSIDNNFPAYDVKTIGDKIFIAYNPSTSFLLLTTMDSSFTVETPVSVGVKTEIHTIALDSDASQNCWISFRTQIHTRAAVYSYTLSPVLSNTWVAGNITNQVNQTMSVVGDTATIFWELPAANPSNHLITSSTIKIDGTVGTGSTFLRSVGIAAKSFVENGVVYLPVVHQSPLQSTYYIYNSEKTCVARLAYQLGGELITNETLSYVPKLGESKYLFACNLKGPLQSNAGQLFANKGIVSYELDFTSENRFQNSQLGCLYMSGASTQMYDGVSVVEDGSHLYPEGYTGVQAPNNGYNNLQNGSYSYQVTYEWTDNLGQIHRSAPGVPLQVVIPTYQTKTLSPSAVNTVTDTITTTTHNYVTGLRVTFGTSGTLPAPLSPGVEYWIIAPNANTIKLATSYANAMAGTAIDITTTGTGDFTINPFQTINKVTLTIPTLRLTAKNSLQGRDDVRITVYRTEANGTIYYRCTSLSSPLYNSIAGDTVTFVDTMPDSTLISSEILYTTGGILENMPSPANSLITTFQNRIVCNSEDPLEIAYSKERIEGEPVNFSDFFRIRVDSRGGDITALGVIDSNLIIFKRSAIFVVSGEGPNNLGQQNGYSIPQLITTDVGCNNPNSIVVTPDGLMFKSSKGIYLLSRGLSTTYIGAEVEAFNSKLITSAILVSDVNQVRFTTNDDTCLVYDYLFRQWSTFTNHTAEDSELFGEVYCFVRKDGSVWQEQKGMFRDDSSPIPMKFTTAWLSLDGLQGYERVRRMMLLGTYKSPHKLRVRVGYDFNQIYTQEAVINVDETLSIGHYGDASPYGSQELYGGEDSLYQFNLHLTQQKCQSLRFSVYDIQGDEIGEGYSISNMALEVASKKGLKKTSNRHKYSSSN